MEGKIRKNRGNTIFTATLRAASLAFWRILIRRWWTCMRRVGARLVPNRSASTSTRARRRTSASWLRLARFRSAWGPALAGEDFKLHHAELAGKVGKRIAQLAAGFDERRIQRLSGFKAQHHQVQRSRQALAEFFGTPPDPPVEDLLRQHVSNHGSAHCRHGSPREPRVLESRNAECNQRHDGRPRYTDANVGLRCGRFVSGHAELLAKPVRLPRPNRRGAPNAPQRVHQRSGSLFCCPAPPEHGVAHGEDGAHDQHKESGEDAGWSHGTKP
jgi:hypothetical protein